MQTDVLALVREVTAAVAATHDVDEVLTRIARLSARALGVWECDIYEYSPATHQLVATATWAVTPTPFDDEWIGDTLDVDELPDYRIALETGLPVELHADDEHLDPFIRTVMEQWGEKSWLLVPLVFGGRPIGVLELVEERERREFSDEDKEVAATIAVPAAIAIHNAHLYRRMAEQNRFLGSLVESSRAMSSTVDLDDLLRRVAQEASEALHTSQAAVYTHDHERDALIYRIVYERVPTRGTDDPIGSVYPFSEFPGNRAIEFSDDIVVEHESDVGLPADRRRSIDLWSEKTVLSVPLRFQDKRLGLLRLYEFDEEREFSALELQLARGLGELAGAAIHNARLYQRSKEYAARLESSYLETVTALAAAMEAKDHYTAEHADMLAMMAVSVGRRLGLDESELRDLQYASVLHDIGKIGIPGHILNKPGRLTDEEYAVMAEHTVIGERIISRIDYLAPIGKAVRAAHERWDGRGYPDELAGEQIPLLSRILFVCDAFHAMTSDRPYRGAMPQEDALNELRRNAGAQFDPAVVQAFLEVWPQLAASGVTSPAGVLN